MRDCILYQPLQVIILVFVHPALTETLIQWLNYGVLFKSTPVPFATEYWLHTYEIRLPSSPAIPSSPCQHGPLPLLSSSYQTHILSLQTKRISQLNTTDIQITQLIPESKLKSPSWSKRGLLNFAGAFSKIRNGTATTWCRAHQTHKASTQGHIFPEWHKLVTNGSIHVHMPIWIPSRV